MFIFAPFILLLNDGVKYFTIIFYFIYLPSLIFSVLEVRYEKKYILPKKTTPIGTKPHKRLKENRKTVDCIEINK